jgi:hypothetical protein
MVQTILGKVVLIDSSSAMVTQQQSLHLLTSYLLGLGLLLRVARK